jgi:hypothetical protein
MWDATRPIITPLYTHETVEFITGGKDIQTRIDFTNIDGFSDQGLVENIRKVFEHFGINNVNISPDLTLPLQQERRRGLPARDLSNGAKQFCINPSLEIFSLVQPCMNPSNDVIRGTGCPNK